MAESSDRGIIEPIAARAAELTAWRRDLHAHPETAFEEHRTAAMVAERLADFGIEVATGLARTGVVGTLHGDGEGPVIALRADLDALHLDEENDFAHRSTHAGRMHACGHDGHTTMLLAAARYLAQTRKFAGTVHFIFQPAEENEGGGRVMVEEGLFDRFPAEHVFGLHNWPWLPAGEMAVHVGPVMAAADRFDVVIEGKGGHGAMPHQCVDPVVVAAQVITALQTITSRTTSPTDCAVVSVTRLRAGHTYNVIPARVNLSGTTRSFSPEVRQRIEARMGEIVAGICAAHGAVGHLDYRSGYPATVNDAEAARWAVDAARAVVGPQRVHEDLPPSTGAEDFAYLARARPGCYVWLGTGVGPDPPGLHHPRFDFNDDMLAVGASYWARLVERRLRATP
jgi:amidohydrolase